MPTVEELISYSRSLVGLTADPASPWRAEYLATIAPGETPARAAEMALNYNCELLCRAVLRRFCEHPLLAAPYPDGTAGHLLMALALAARAVRLPHELPQPGDIVLVSPPEHAWICVAQPGATYDGAVLYDGVEGLPVEGYRAVATRQHVIRDGRDDAGGDRAIVAVIDTMACIAAFGR